MAPRIAVKICGLRRASDLEIAAEAGARYAGLNFFAPSPRSVDVAEARTLARGAPSGIAKVGLVVDADDDTLDRIVGEIPLDLLQLHGHETPERVAELRDRHGLPVIKVVGVAAAEDVERLAVYEGVADMILVDARPPEGAELPGGNGLAFDWRLIAGRSWKKPWMLAGGLTPENVGAAVAATGAVQVDVASGVESAPGVKDADRIRAFIAAAQAAG